MINKPILKAAINVALAAVMLIMAIVAGVMLTGCENPKNTVSPPSKVEDNNGNEMSEDTVYPMPKGLSFSDAKNGAEGSTQVTITASIAPLDAADKRVDWIAEWKNSSSSFASGKSVNEYVTVIPTTEYGLTATVNCLKDFGEQIIVKVTSLANPEANANCTIDFKRKIKDVSIVGENISYNAENKTYIFPYALNVPFTLDFVHTNYTIDVSDFGLFSFRFNPALVAEAASHQLVMDGINSFNFAASKFIEAPFTSFSLSLQTEVGRYLGGGVKGQTRELLQKYIDSNTHIFELKLSDNNVSTIYKITLLNTSVSADDVTLDKDNIIF